MCELACRPGRTVSSPSLPRTGNIFRAAERGNARAQADQPTPCSLPHHHHDRDGHEYAHLPFHFLHRGRVGTIASRSTTAYFLFMSLINCPLLLVGDGPPVKLYAAPAKCDDTSIRLTLGLKLQNYGWDVRFGCSIHVLSAESTCHSSSEA